MAAAEVGTEGVLVRAGCKDFSPLFVVSQQRQVGSPIPTALTNYRKGVTQLLSSTFYELMIPRNFLLLFSFHSAFSAWE